MRICNELAHRFISCMAMGFSSVVWLVLRQNRGEDVYKAGLFEHGAKRLNA
ncbi:hypothetical protein EGR_09248 [Echinococcus granulosus]|uniref:Uncharacterized protein n=1 Tax=Echinococcus granulosus TaxID=6210 RepID=W6U5M3_ECHGR|nr:hypothetical protein EGR_09248 [Echinococcus granulosus]EUB55891.1 hypothetical protein EGR_09248 [Echinococcus granulosus]